MSKWEEVACRSLNIPKTQVFDRGGISDGNGPTFLGLGSGRALGFRVGSGSGWPENTFSG